MGSIHLLSTREWMERTLMDESGLRRVIEPMGTGTMFVRNFFSVERFLSIESFRKVEGQDNLQFQSPESGNSFIPLSTNSNALRCQSVNLITLFVRNCLTSSNALKTTDQKLPLHNLTSSLQGEIKPPSPPPPLKPVLPLQHRRRAPKP